MKKNSNNIFLSVVIPAYNEEYNLRTGVLQSVYGYLRKQDYTWEIIVVDDGSNDKTAELVTRYTEGKSKITLMKQPHRGKGATVIAGMLKAKGDVIIFSDTDQATPIDQVKKILPKIIDEDFDVVIGARSGREGAPVIRKVMAYGFSVLRYLLLRLPFKDTQCGFKAFKKDAAKKIFGKLKVFSATTATQGASVSAGFDLEILYVARKLGLKVTEVDVDWHHKEGTKVNPIKDSWEGLRDLMKVRLNALKGMYK
ncbi:glycosyltransferase [Candidatus Microgenomates bacterium]|nr:glycosyltransferase [Candidatus Microgenomates bacterium]